MMIRRTDQPNEIALNLEHGDVFACWGRDWISRGISLETSLTSWIVGPSGLRFSPSHVAIVSELTGEAGLWWFESTTMSQRICRSSGYPTRGVQVHSVADRIFDYVTAGGRVDQYRLTECDRLESQDFLRLERMLSDYVGREDRAAIGYDTAGALFSGLRLTTWLPVLRANAETLFCSELIAALLQRLCRMNRSNPARFNPGRLMRTLVRQGTYAHLRRFDGDTL